MAWSVSRKGPPASETHLSCWSLNSTRTQAQCRDPRGVPYRDRCTTAARAGRRDGPAAQISGGKLAGVPELTHTI